MKMVVLFDGGYIGIGEVNHFEEYTSDGCLDMVVCANDEEVIEVVKEMLKNGSGQSS